MGKKFYVHEVQELIEWVKFLHVVEATSPEEALKKVQAGLTEPEPHDGYGDPDYGKSGYCVTPAEDYKPDREFWDEAADDLTKRI